MKPRQIKLPKAFHDNWIENTLPDIDGDMVDDLGRVNNVRVSVIESYNSRGYTVFRLFKIKTIRGKTVGFIEASNNRHNQFSANNVGLHTNYQGQKLMPKVYKHLIDCGYKIKPGEAQTKGGRSIWKELRSNCY